MDYFFLTGSFVKQDIDVRFGYAKIAQVDCIPRNMLKNSKTGMFLLNWIFKIYDILKIKLKKCLIKIRVWVENYLLY